MADPLMQRVSEKKGWEQRSGGAEGTDNVWIQSSRNPTQNFVHPHAASPK